MLSLDKMSLQRPAGGELLSSADGSVSLFFSSSMPRSMMKFKLHVLRFQHLLLSVWIALTAWLCCSLMRLSSLRLTLCTK
jgi:hypothetical protein